MMILWKYSYPSVIKAIENEGTEVQRELLHNLEHSAQKKL